MAVGPVEYLVIAFPGSRFAEAIAPVLADAVASGAVRARDLAFVRRAEDGTPTRAELRELDPEGVVPRDAGEGGAEPGLTASDVDVVGRGLPQGDSLALVVRDDLWTPRLAAAVRAAGGAFVAHERLGAGAPDADGGAEDDIITRLERLAELRQRDVLTDAEFAEQKAKLLAD
ncbi:DUF6325 family protein [Streptomyces sp. cmx-18-6]|uniref:SHOCT domain-containing protein n=1 Tax=Streptomyces sp. cmx-18-6 TaxID=2790930 RepID=UPI00397EB433